MSLSTNYQEDFGFVAKGKIEDVEDEDFGFVSEGKVSEGKKSPQRSEPEYGGRVTKGLVKSPGLMGDISTLLGIDQPDMLPGQKARLELEAKAKPEDLIWLNESDDILPSYSPTATTEKTTEFTEKLGLPKGEPETFGESC